MWAVPEGDEAALGDGIGDEEVLTGDEAGARRKDGADMRMPEGDDSSGNDNDDNDDNDDEAVESEDSVGVWRNLQNLKNLLRAGFIDEEEYQSRKAQLVDELTGTSTFTTMTKENTQSSRKAIPQPRRRRQPASNVPEIVPRGPPDFGPLEAEAAIKYTYNLERRKWSRQKVHLKLDTVPFAKGALRLVFHMLDLSQKAEDDTTYVIKISMDVRDNISRQIYFRDVEMQAVAKHYAAKFNEYDPPKRVDFVSACIFELVEREGKPVCGVERFIEGPYIKHNSNYGYMSSLERNTPQAFSHFTYEASGRSIIIVDIQGVGDAYTDPQVISADGNGWGKGNLGARGIEKFKKTHRCNAICRFLKLPPFNPSYKDVGTLPAAMFMSRDRVEPVSAHENISDSAVDPTMPLLPPIRRDRAYGATNGQGDGDDGDNDKGYGSDEHLEDEEEREVRGRQRQRQKWRGRAGSESDRELCQWCVLL